MKTESIQLAKIRTDGGTQPRAAINPEVVADYRERMEDGDVFPPIVVFFDGTHYWLADGFHRVEAARSADFTAIDAEVHQGALLDAQWYSYSANKGHDNSGLRRSNADKRRAVEAALRHSYAQKYSDRQVAEWIGVSNHMVGDYRKTTVKDSQSPIRTGRDGRTINTANIGKSKPAPEKHVETAIVDTNTGEVIEDAEVVKVTTSTTRETATAKGEAIQPRGIGIDKAYAAIAILKEIPLNDGLRQEALATVARWIEHNK